MRQLFYYKMRQFLKNATLITNCKSYILLRLFLLLHSQIFDFEKPIAVSILLLLLLLLLSLSLSLLLLL